MIYFIEAVGMNQIKIGKTNDVVKRLGVLQVANAAKLEIVRVIDGGETREAQLHEMFAAFRLHGEWFSASEVRNSFYLIEEEPLSIEDLLSAPRRFGYVNRARRHVPKSATQIKPQPDVKEAKVKPEIKTRVEVRFKTIEVPAKSSPALDRERTRLEVLRARIEERLQRKDDDKKALQIMIWRLVSWVHENVDMGDDELPRWFAEALHMSSYGNPARRGARPILPGQGRKRPL